MPAPFTPGVRVARLTGLATAVVLLTVGFGRLAPGPERAAAAVGHRSGYRATVDGFTSWYGSYDMGAIGPAWCIDHGIRAPDPALAYIATELVGTPADLQVALAWALGRHGVEPDRSTSAALMLVAHDLMAATYPSGDLDVDRIDTRWLAGFGGDESAVLSRAQSIKADALAHRDLRPPWAIEVTADDPPPGQPGTLTARVTAAGVPVSGLVLQATATGSSFGGALTTALTTGPDGTASAGFGAADGPYRFDVVAAVPDLDLQAFAPTRARAQRVARAATVPLLAAVDRVGVVPHGQLRIRKVGIAGLPVAGARFEVRPVDVGDDPAEVAVLRDLVIGPDGTVGPLLLPVGSYVVTEVEPPPGYLLAEPQTVVVTGGQVIEVEVVNRPVPTTTTSTTAPTTTSSTSTTTSTSVTSTTLAASTTTTPPATAATVLGNTLPRTLPHTGADPGAWACIGSGLVLVGTSLRPRRGLTTTGGHP